MKKLLRRWTHAPLAIALAFLLTSPVNAATSTATSTSSGATLDTLKADITKLTTTLATLQTNIATLQTDVTKLGNRGQMAILHAIPPKDRKTSRNATAFVVLGNNGLLTKEVSGETKFLQFGERITGSSSGVSPALELPDDGVYLIELTQPPLPSAADRDSELTASVLAEYAHCEKMIAGRMRWEVRNGNGGSGYYPTQERCHPARIFFNYRSNPHASRFRAYGGGFIFVSKHDRADGDTVRDSFTVRFGFPDSIVTTKRQIDTYAALLKITRLK